MKRCFVGGFIEDEATVRRTLEAFKRDLEIAVGSSRNNLEKAICDLERALRNVF